MDEGGIRRATPDDAEVVADILTGAFATDPVWGPWCFPDADRRSELSRRFWRFFVDASIPAGYVWITPGREAMSLWVPPGMPELPPPYEERSPGFLVELLGEHGHTVLEGMERFESAHPRDEPHHYLSLLATHPAHRGHGFGMALLAANLRDIDREGMAAYLESTNPINDRRYASQGFGVVGSFDVPGGPSVHTMWRPARRA